MITTTVATVRVEAEELISVTMTTETMMITMKMVEAAEHRMEAAEEDQISLQQKRKIII